MPAFVESVNVYVV